MNPSLETTVKTGLSTRWVTITFSFQAD